MTKDICDVIEVLDDFIDEKGGFSKIRLQTEKGKQFHEVGANELSQGLAKGQFSRLCDATNRANSILTAFAYKTSKSFDVKKKTQQKIHTLKFL